MTDQEIKKKGWSVAIYRAVEAAGGMVQVAAKMNMESTQGVMGWYRRRSIPAHRINQLCAMTGGKVTPQQILDELEESRAAA